MTESAAALENVTRWLGIGIAVLGALLANPAATQHSAGVLGQRAKVACRRVRRVAARFIPAFRRSATIPAGTAEGCVSLSGEAGGVARGYADWGPDATTDEKIDMLSERTEALNKEVSDLFSLVSKTEQQLLDRLAEGANRLTADTAALRSHVDSMQREAVQSDATALPLIVVGVVLADVSSDAAQFQLWFWLLLLLIALVLAGWSAARLIRTWSARA